VSEVGGFGLCPLALSRRAKPIDLGLRYLKLRFPDCRAWQISGTGSTDYLSPEGIRVALVLLRELI